MRQKFSKTALVTGAGARIGRVIALTLARAGYDVCLHYNQVRAKAEAVARDIEALSRRAHVIACNLEDKTALGALVPEVVHDFGPLSVLVNNASVFLKDGVLDDAPLPTSKSWVSNFAVNLEAPVFLAEAFARQYLDKKDDFSDSGIKHGVIINMLDQRVLKLNPLFFSYTLSKTALWTATRTLAQALAPHIRVNGVGPGPTLANNVEREQAFAREAAGVLLAEAVSPSCVAEAVLYLCGAQSVTGQMLAVDNGQHLVWQTPDLTV